MAKKYKVKTAAVFNGQPAGSIIELDESAAKKFEAMKYVKIIEEIKPKPKADEKGKSAPKKSVSKPKQKSKESK